MTMASGSGKGPLNYTGLTLYQRYLDHGRQAIEAGS